MHKFLLFNLALKKGTGAVLQDLEQEGSESLPHLTIVRGLPHQCKYLRHRALYWHDTFLIQLCDGRRLTTTTASASKAADKNCNVTYPVHVASSKLNRYLSVAKFRADF